MKITHSADFGNVHHIIPEEDSAVWTTSLKGTILSCATKVSGDCKKSVNGQPVTMLTLDNYQYVLEVDMAGATIKDLGDICVQKELSVLSQARLRQMCAEQGRNVLQDAEPVLDDSRKGEKAVDTKGRKWYTCRKIIRFGWRELVPESTTRTAKDPDLTTLYQLCAGDHERAQAAISKFGTAQAAVASIKEALATLGLL